MLQKVMGISDPSVRSKVTGTYLRILAFVCVLAIVSRLFQFLTHLSFGWPLLFGIVSSFISAVLVMGFSAWPYALVVHNRFPESNLSVWGVPALTGLLVGTFSVLGNLTLSTTVSGEGAPASDLWVVWLVFTAIGPFMIGGLAIAAFHILRAIIPAR